MAGLKWVRAKRPGTAPGALESVGVKKSDEVRPRSIDPSEYADTDGDGTGDNADGFPEDPAASRDSDGDGHPNEWNPGRTRGDPTTGLELDRYPADSERWMEERRGEEREGDGAGWMSGPIPVMIVVLVALSCILLASYRLHRRKSGPE